MNQSRQRITKEPTIQETDYEALYRFHGRLTSYIFADKFWRLKEVDNPPIIRDVLLRLDAPMQTRWITYWAGTGRGYTPNLQGVLKFL